MSKFNAFKHFQPDLLTAERHQLTTWLPEAFGYYLVALSDQLNSEDLTSSKIQRRFIARSDSIKAGHLITTAAELPFADSSIDCLIYHHQLAHSQDLKQSLAEADRVLISHGQLFIIDVNLHSLVGLWQRFTSNTHPSPRHSLASLITSLSISPFLLEESMVFFHQSPWQTWPIIDFFLARLWPTSGAAYALRLRKKTLCLTPSPISCQTFATANI